MEPILHNFLIKFTHFLSKLDHFIILQYFVPLHWNGPAYNTVCNLLLDFYSIDPSCQYPWALKTNKQERWLLATILSLV
jgi:hypothetical protein